MLKTLIRELKSRKYRATIAGIAAATLGEVGVIQNIWAYVCMAAAYVLGVALEDAGKSRAQVEVAAKAPELLKPE